MKTLMRLIGVLAVASFFASCNLDNTASPSTQDIVYSDTSLITGELSVEVLYFDQAGQNYKPAPSGTGVFLFATFEDLQNNMPIYALQTTNSNSVYFGFINYGNYYVLGFNNTSLNNYEGVSVVQVRPRRHEVLTLSMYKTAKK
ncbi:MAG: hypothetical protein K9H64_04285 [Bacteroidales bacterium]|nr:hypothetical protein [Bacteroidales bacterium]MCF8455014.1 hypothetical protein [Bacteroidales bacterium]